MMSPSSRGLPFGALGALAAVSIAACGRGGFSGQTKTPAQVPEPPRTGLAASTNPTPTSTPVGEDGTASTEPTAVPPVGTPPVTTTPLAPVAPAQCLKGIDYDPSEIKCALPVKTGNSLWMSVEGYKKAIEAFTDAGAAWISPLEPKQEGSLISCPFVPGSDKLISVSHFDVPTTGEYVLEVINDDTGSFEAWFGGDPNLKLEWTLPSGAKSTRIETNGYVNVGANIRAGRIVLVVESIDVGQSATGLVLSVKEKATGRVVLKTESDPKKWCIFRQSKAVDARAFVLDKAVCRSCFTGKAP